MCVQKQGNLYSPIKCGVSTIITDKEAMKIRKFSSSFLACALCLMLFLASTSTAQLIHFDDFEYYVDKNSEQGCSNFLSAGWQFVKCINCPPFYRGAGYIYTIDSIPGYQGVFPGINSKRVLVLESKSGTMQTQTDFYLRYGDGNTPNAIPGNVWFQFWIYINHYGNELSEVHGKFLYPCDGPYPCQTGHWLFILSKNSSNPYGYITSTPGEVFGTMRDEQTCCHTANYSLAAPWDRWKLGYTDTSARWSPNKWILVKLHFDTQSPQGTYEQWLRPLGASNWTKVSEWIGGVTPNFTWPIDSANRRGHRVLSIPTTLGGLQPQTQIDSWIYMDDFAMAGSESDLPQYTTTGVLVSSMLYAVTVSPNPFSTQAIIEFSHTLHNANLTVVNVSGQTGAQIKNINGNKVALQRDALPAGLYFIQLEDNNQLTTTKVVITD